MTVSFYLKDIHSVSPTAIYARIFYGSYEAKFYISESIHPVFWDKQTKRTKQTKKFPEFPEFNRRLDTLAIDIKNTIRKYANENNSMLPTPDTLKLLLDIAIKNKGIKERVTFMNFFQEFIDRSENGTRLTSIGKPVTTGTIKNYYTTKVCLENYQKHAKCKIDFDNIDLAFYNDFVKYLTLNAKQSTNYIGKHIKTIKTVLNEATELGHNKNDAFKKKGFTTIREEADTIYLDKDELKELADADLSGTPGLERARDLFVVGCYTGLRFSDLSTLQPSQIKNGLITLTQIKTSKPVIIPVHPEVQKIMDKYYGSLPPAISNQKANDHLKDIGEKTECLKKIVTVSGTKGGEALNKTVPKWKLLTTHTARRSFATNEYLAGTPTLTIMAITGHKTETAFMKYIRVTRDQHAKILQGIWEDRKEKPVKKKAKKAA